MSNKKPLNRQLIITEDGSHTIHIPELNEHYHSIHGAIQESNHIFIKSGLEYFTNTKEINILEVGFGTGLNVFLTCVEAFTKNIQINYTTIEKYPLTIDEIENLNYADKFDEEQKKHFQQIQSAKWGAYKEINTNLKLKKINTDLINYTPDSKYNLVYFDAFGPDIQPKLWTESVFKKMYNCMSIGGVLVTYSAKGQVRRNMQSAGFTVERLPGPPGKREMLRASK